MEPLEAHALGQLLFLESVVAQLPNKIRMLQFTVRGLESLPGVREVGFRLPDEPAPPGGSRGLALEVSHRGHHHATLHITLADEARFSAYLPYLKNLASMLGLILTERLQSDENLRYRTQLESLVVARTQALIESEGRARAMLRTARDGVWLVDSRDRLVEVNDAACAMLGYAYREMLGLPLDRIEAGEAPSRLSCFRKDGSCLFETDHRRRDGTEFPVEVSGTFHLETGQAVVFVRDITERRQAVQSQRMESLGRLAGGVAHDMNNVLGAILSLASFNLEQCPAGCAVHSDFDTIAKAAARGGQLVKSLLSFARRTPAEERAVNLNPLLMDLVHLLERTTLSRIRLELELEPGLRPIRGDASAISHAIMNLCVNAVDAMPGEGTLLLRTRNVDDAAVEVQVADTGSGMAEEVLQRALDPFYSTKEMGKGTGLGLPLAYSTVQAHHGQMDIRTVPGRGTVVTLSFPASDPAASMAGRASEARGRDAGAVLEVLLVDDDPLVQCSTQALLGRLGHRVATAIDGEGALSMIWEGYRPDVVLLDLNMPGLGGAGTLPRLRELLPGLPIILATGKPDQFAQDLVDGYPGVALLAKPFTLDELRKRLALRIA